jgi:hypothetical protein
VFEELVLVSDFPYVINLPSGKSTDIYLQLFFELEQHAERLNKKFDPRHVMSDFEMSLIKAVSFWHGNAPWLLFSLLPVPV